MTKKKHLGIYSGSFDPVHEGHIAFAKEAQRICSLDSIIFIPEQLPREKPNVSPISERVTELEIALIGTPFTVVNLHTDQFTIPDTLPELELMYPDTLFTFLIGSDVAKHLAKWEGIDYLTKKHNFAIGMRSNDSLQAIGRIMNTIHAEYVTISTPHKHVSSRTLRRDTKNNR